MRNMNIVRDCCLFLFLLYFGGTLIPRLNGLNHNDRLIQDNLSGTWIAKGNNVHDLKVFVHQSQRVVWWYAEDQIVHGSEENSRSVGSSSHVFHGFLKKQNASDIHLTGSWALIVQQGAERYGEHDWGILMISISEDFNKMRVIASTGVYQHFSLYREVEEGTNTSNPVHPVEPTPDPSDDETCFCTMEYDPVCAKVNGDVVTFPNRCFAECQNAIVLFYGRCR